MGRRQVTCGIRVGNRRRRPLHPPDGGRLLVGLSPRLRILSRWQIRGLRPCRDVRPGREPHAPPLGAKRLCSQGTAVAGGVPAPARPKVEEGPWLPPIRRPCTPKGFETQPRVASLDPRGGATLGQLARREQPCKGCTDPRGPSLFPPRSGTRASRARRTRTSRSTGTSRCRDRCLPWSSPATPFAREPRTAAAAFPRSGVRRTSCS